jgi:GntR family transcriptional regulator
MRMGLEALVHAGLIERRRGKGTVVKRPPIQQTLSRFYSIAREMRQQGLELKTQVLARGHFDVQDELAALACDRLGLPDPSQVGYLLRLRLVEGTPLLLETVTFPAALCPALLDMPMAQADDLGSGSFYEVLRREANMHVTSAHETFRPLLATSYEARLLSISTGMPVFEVERTSFVSEQKVEWRRTLARGDRYRYEVDLLNPVEEGDVGE